MYKLVPSMQTREEENQIVFMRTLKAETGDVSSPEKLDIDENAVVSKSLLKSYQISWYRLAILCFGSTMT